MIELRHRRAFAIGAIAMLLMMFASTAADIHAEPFQRSRAIIVGIDDYRSTIFPPLRTAAVDARRVAEYLREQQYEIVLLLDSEATRERIVGALRKAAVELGANDRLLFFFGGHGFTKKVGDRESGHIVPYDIASLVSMEDLQSEAERLRNVRHQLFIMNSCYGGTIGILLRAAGADPRAPTYLEEVTRRRARQFITAGGPDQQVMDGGPGGLSYFAHYFLEATARGLADLNGDGVVTFGELAAYLVPAASNALQTPAYGMLPGHAMGEFIFHPTGNEAVARQIPTTRPPPSTTTASTDLSAVARSFGDMQKPIDDLYAAWVTLDLGRYLAQWAPDAVQFIGSRRRAFADIKAQREQLFPRLTRVDVERYQLWYRGYRDGVAHFDASYDMTFRFMDGRAVRERQRESYKVRRSGGRWLIVENQDYKR